MGANSRVASESQGGHVEVLIGVGPDGSGEDAVALGALAARALGLPVTVACIFSPGIDYPSHGAVDAEWVRYEQDRAQAAVDAALTLLRARWGIEARGTLYPSRAESRGLRDLASESNAALLVIGSGADGPTGRIQLGSTVNALLHSSPAPVAVAPGGFASEPPERLERLVVGFGPTPGSEAAAEVALRLAQGTSLTLSLLSLAVAPTRMAGSRLGPNAEQPVIDALVEADRARQQEFSRHHPEVDGTIVTSASVPEALSRLEWGTGDVLVLGSSSGGLLGRVFLGDMTHRLMRASSIPVLVVPRETD